MNFGVKCLLIVMVLVVLYMGDVDMARVCKQIGAVVSVN